ncbi:MAG: hypothetical protein WCC12_18420 [Anaerolineales bacterium]
MLNLIYALIPLIAPIVLLALIVYGASRIGLINIDWNVDLTHVAIGVGVFLGIPLLCLLIWFLGERIGEIATRYPLPFTLAGITGVIVIAAVRYRNRRRKVVQSIHETVASIGISGGAQCSKCGKIYQPILLLGATSIRVAQCGVCPANHVFAVCERCADLDALSRAACPWCSSMHSWQIKEMELSK